MVKTQGSNEYANIRSIIQDRSGNLWVATIEEGVYRFDGSSFTQITIKEGLCSNTVWSLLEDKSGKIWIGTDEGISVFDGKSYSKYAITTPVGKDFSSSTVASSASKTSVWSIMQDRSGLIWVGTSEGIYCYDGLSFKDFLKENSEFNKENLQLKTIGKMLEDQKGNIWFCSGMPGGSEGLCCFDGKSICSTKPANNNWVRNILENEHGDLIVATRHAGVGKLIGKTYLNFTEQAGIGNASITTIFIDKAGVLWIGTELSSADNQEHGGLWRYDGTDFRNFTTRDGLIHNGVWSIFEDKEGFLWIGTRNNGLCRFDGKTFTNFSE
jgi:ligand-binding sensor domain-containing protein